LNRIFWTAAAASVLLHGLVYAALAGGGRAAVSWTEGEGNAIAVTMRAQTNAGRLETQNPNPNQNPNQNPTGRNFEDGGDMVRGGPVSAASLGLRAVYPRLSRVLGEQGNVTVGVAVANGDVVKSWIGRSSGLSRLDDAAKKAVSQWKPSRNDGTLEIEFQFKLRD
jgi:TonB family protein